MAKKKLNKITELKRTIKELQEDCRELTIGKEKYEDVLEQIRHLFRSNSCDPLAYRSTKFSELPLIIDELKNRVKRMEGVKSSEKETIERLTDIIRWQIKPSTAEKKTEAERKLSA